MKDYKEYVSPFSSRYGSKELRYIWGEEHKRILWRKIWAYMAESKHRFGLVTEEQYLDLRENVDNLDIERSLEIERAIHHDLVAELKTFAEQCKIGGAIIHMGATSEDIKDNATAIQIKESLKVIGKRLEELLKIFADLCDAYADRIVIGFTHLQTAEPTTLGYRLAFTAQDLLSYYHKLIETREKYRGKGFKGAMGNGASYVDMFGKKNYIEFEKYISRKMDLEFFPITNQTYTRIQEFDLLSVLAGIGAILNKLAFDLRILQNTMIGELSEPFDKDQVGSSAMPFKKNPINSEKVNSLARMLAQFPRVAWENVAMSLLDRTLDDSANRRSILPEAFLIVDEMLSSCIKIFENLNIYEEAIEKNISAYGIFSAIERVLTALSEKGMDRQEAHEILRKHSLNAWKAIREGDENPLEDLILGDKKIKEYLNYEDVKSYYGIAEERARWIAKKIRKEIN